MRFKIRRARELMRTLRNLAANARGYVYAGTAALARMWKCCERTVYRWLDELERVGDIKTKIVGRLRRIYVVGLDAQMAFNFDAECQPECQPECQSRCQSSIPANPAARQELPPNSGAYLRDLRDLRDLNPLPLPLPAEAGRGTRDEKEGSPKNPAPGRRALGTNPRAQGTNLRAQGASPRATQQNPRRLTRRERFWASFREAGAALVAAGLLAPNEGAA
jgi:hypothetical protein